MATPAIARLSLENNGSSSTPGSSRHERIPPALQQVFLQSNRGKEVNKPPPNSAASKTFQVTASQQRSIAADEASSHSKRRAHPSPPRSKQCESKPSRMGRERTRRAPPKRQRSLTGLSPQQHLDELLEKRGYKLKSYRTLQTAYYNSPSKWQIASYGPRTIELIRNNDVDGIRSMLKAGCLSPNPCNLFGESLIHMICRRGDIELLLVLLDNGASVQVSDDYGRTPLHDACWSATPALDVAELLIEQDPRLFYMKDKRGALPLSYVTRDYWYLWRQFLDRMVDAHFPSPEEWNEKPILCTQSPNTCALPEPKDRMPSELVTMVTNGTMSLREARYMKESGALNRMMQSVHSALDESEYDDSDEDSDWLDDSDIESDEEEEDDDEFEIEDQVSSMMSMMRAWDKK